jgi:hypothetical protein
MAPQQQYTLDDFQRFARANFPAEYASIADANLHRFENRWTMDEQNQAHKLTLLFIGRYYRTKPGGSEAWAHATISGITYYSGKANEICKPVLARYESRIYPDYPLDFMLKSESLQNMRWMVKEYLMEAAINFAFLLAAQLKCVHNVKGRDMLIDFADACSSFRRYKVAMMATGVSSVRQPLTLDSPIDISDVRATHEQLTKDDAQSVDNERGAARNILVQRPLIEGDGMAFDISQQRK